MAQLTKALLLQSLEEWKHYPEAFARLPMDQQGDFLKSQGYGSVRDLMAHVGAWWEEGRKVIGEAIKHPDRPAPKYDFAEFNAAAVNRFKDTPEADFMGWYENQRQEMVKVVESLTDDQMKIRRVAGWLDGVILEHLKEHGVDAPRFLTVDALQREWAGYLERFKALPPEKQEAFLKKQGYARLRDLAAHIIAWWEQGMEVIEKAGEADAGQAADVDAFNAQAVERFAKLDEAEVYAAYEKTRLTLANLIDALPDEVLSKPNVQEWLRADVLEHYYEHAL